MLQIIATVAVLITGVMFLVLAGGGILGDMAEEIVEDDLAQASASETEEEPDEHEEGVPA